MIGRIIIAADYYREKSEEFANLYGISFTPFEQRIKNGCQGNPNPVKYIEDLLNGIIDEVVKKTGRTFDDVKAEYISRYI